MNISVIIPTFNRASFIVKAIESVLGQSIGANEIVVVDDGSTDETKIEVNHYPIKYFYQSNQGVSSARNFGIRQAKNDWICFLDSDDIWEFDKLEKQIEFHKQNPHILFSHTDERWLFNDKEIYQKAHQRKDNRLTFIDNLENTFIGCSTVMIHKSILEKELFDESLKACEDYDLWLRILGNWELGYINQKLIKKIAGHQGQLSFETPLMDTYRIKALLKHLDSPFKVEVKKELIKRCEILIKGAKKYENLELENYYSNLKLSLLNKL